MGATRRAVLGLMVGLGVSAAALTLVVRWAGWRPLVEALRAVDLRYLALGVSIFLVSMVARAACWQVLLGRRVSLGRALAALNQGYLLNNILPWRMGEFGRAVLLGRRPGLSVPTVLSSILVERLYDVILAVGLLIALLPWAAGAAWAPRAALLATSAALGGLAVVAGLLHWPDLAARMLNRLPGDPQGWGRRWAAFRDGLAALQNPRQAAVSFAWLTLSWGLAAVEYWAVVRAIVPSAQLLWAGFMLTVTLLGVAIPSSPGYLGVFEAAGVAALSAFGVPPAQALAAALVLHGMVYSIASALGAIALVGDGETLAGLFGEARRWWARRQGRECAS